MIFCHYINLVCWSCVLSFACTCVFAVYYQCLLGKLCRIGGKCLSPSQWCDGVMDCSHGEDEAQCCEISTSTSSLPNMWMCLCTSDHWTAWWMGSNVFSVPQFASMGPTSSSKVTQLTARVGCRCVLIIGTTTMGELCVSKWDTAGTDCHPHYRSPHSVGVVAGTS